MHKIIVKMIDVDAALPIRHQVLWPDKPEEFCRVAGDDSAHHFGAFLDNKLVCVASIYIDETRARLRKFATLEAYQGQGIGSHLIGAILNKLKHSSTTHLWCDARESALQFYQRFGFEKTSERFYKSDIPYFKIEVELSKTIL